MCENSLRYKTSFGVATQFFSLVKKLNGLLMTPYWLLVCHTSVENRLVEQDLKLKSKIIMENPKLY